MEVIDLSHAIETGMQRYPDDPPVSLDPHATVAEDGYRVTALHLGTHSGTHVDAPSHVIADGRSLDSYPLEAFSFDATLVDCREHAPREPIRVDDLPDPGPGNLLVVRTGWDDHWGTDRYLDHPYVDEEVADWCVEHGYHVAVDALSVDPTPSEHASTHEPAGIPAHDALCSADRLIIENLANLDGLPRRFRLDAYPLPVSNADGAPVRAVAVVE